MQPVEKRGRLYLITFIVILVVCDLLLKGLLLSVGTLRFSQAGGTFVTILVCWFLWRGSASAYWFMVICIAAAIAFSVFAATKIPMAAAIAMGIFMMLLLLLLLAPATRAFLAYRRSARA